MLYSILYSESILYIRLYSILIGKQAVHFVSYPNHRDDLTVGFLVKHTRSLLFHLSAMWFPAHTQIPHSAPIKPLVSI